jgi:hypothetical protein
VIVKRNIQIVSSDPRKGLLHSPSKSRATMSAPSVGETDIQMPSMCMVSPLTLYNYYSANKPVICIAFLANDVSMRWFRVKLFPTDCSPIDKTTLIGLNRHYGYNKQRSWCQLCKKTLTFDAQEDWKIDLYHLSDKLSTILLTSAPSSNFSSCADITHPSTE